MNQALISSVMAAESTTVVSIQAAFHSQPNQITHKVSEIHIPMLSPGKVPDPHCLLGLII